MKIKAIVFQNKPKKIHGHINKINLFGLQHDLIFKDSIEKKLNK